MPYKNKQDLYDYQNKRWHRLKLKAVEYLGSKCLDCKRDDLNYCCYDFHHRDPKSKDVTWNKLRLRSWKKIVEELDKCDLLCACCHRMRHVNPNYLAKK